MTQLLTDLQQLVARLGFVKLAFYVGLTMLAAHIAPLVALCC